MSDNKLLKAASFYASHGLSIIPCSDKRPTIKSWKEFQSRIMSDDEIINHFTDKNHDTDQIAIIAGIVSGGLEIIDFDIKHLNPDARSAFWDDFNKNLLELSPDIYRKIQIHQTKSGGYHILYRSEEIEGNKKLAKIKVGNRYECIIETRGEGGYVIAPPSDGYVNTNGIINLHILDTEQREIIINLCRSYNEEPDVVIPKKSATRNHNFKKSPFDDYNETEDVLSVLAAHGWKAVQDAGSRIFFRRPGSENFQSANWHRQKKIFYVFSSGDPYLEGGKGYSPSQIYTILQHRGDYKASYKELLSNGYGTKWNDEEMTVIDKVREMSGKDINKIRASVSKSFPSWMDQDIDRIIDAGLHTHDGVFWSVTSKGAIVINNLAYVKFLHEVLGYALWKDSSDQVLPLIKLDRESHQVAIINGDNYVKDDVKNWILKNVEPDDDLHPDALVNAIISKDNKLFTRKQYEWLPMVSFDTFNDTKKYAYFFFRNGIVQVCAGDNEKDIQLLNYADLPDNTYIWKERIRCGDFDIELLPDRDLFLDECYTYKYEDKATRKEVIGYGSAWYKYIRRISGIGPELDSVKIDDLPDEQYNKIISTMSVIGYLLHSYKNPARPWAIIINEDTAEDGKGGGTGKQILTKGIAVLRNLSSQDGKRLKPTETFAFEGLGPEHDVFVMDDVQKWFKIDVFYNLITNDAVFEQKGKGKRYIAYKDSPKFVFSSNFDITGTESAEHLNRRVKFLLINPYYSKANPPLNEIGMVLESGWQNDDIQWQLFFNIMFECVVVYLNKSVIELGKTEKTKEKSIRNKFGDEFFEFVNTAFSDVDEWYYDWFVVKPFYDDFKVKTESKMTLSYFRKALLKYLEVYEIKHETDKSYRGKSSYINDDDFKTYDKQFGIKLLNFN